MRSAYYRMLISLLASLLILLTGLPLGQAQAQAERALNQPSAVVLWNEAMLAAVRNASPRPTVIARSLFLVHQAMFDAWALYDVVALPTLLKADQRRPITEQTEANQAAAVSQAAYQMLVALFPEYEVKTGAFGRLLATLGYAPVDSGEMATPAGIGYTAAQAVLTARANDGSNAANNFVDIVSKVYPALYTPLNKPFPGPAAGRSGAFNPNHWQPLRVPTGLVKDAHGLPVADKRETGSYQDQHFLTPHWGAVQPFALKSGAQFRPPAPPQAGADGPYTDALGQRLTGDEAYNLQVDEVLAISANLSDREKVIAEYWADGPRSETPPGHWNALAHGISMRDQHTLAQDVKLYFALNAALFDASIAVWDAKRAYDCIRPISAIRYKYAGQMITAWGGPNQGTQQIRGEDWQPYQDPTFVTPAFPEFVSGHSVFSAAAAWVLTAFTGSSRFYDGQTLLYNADFNRDGAPDLLGQYVAPVGSNKFEHSPTQVVVLQWETFEEAANEAGISRRYGGIHFQDGDLFGRQMGRSVGAQAYQLAEQYWQGGGQ